MDLRPEGRGAGAQIEDNAVAQAVETIRNRVDEFGVAEPLIARQGKDRILVQLPGIDDPKRVKDLIKNTAFLELSLVEKGPSTRGGAARRVPRRPVPAELKLVEAKAERGQAGSARTTSSASRPRSRAGT